MTREEAITELKDLKDYCHNTFMIKTYEVYAQAINKAIESLENQNIGYWIENAPEWQNIDPPYICSECGNFHLRKTNYCDQCGAKMIEQQKSEDNNETD